MKKEIDLTEKVYAIGILVSTMFYAIGIYFLTPATDKPLLKATMIGGLMIIELFLIILNLNKKTENFDERAIENLYKAGTTAFAITATFVLAFAIVSLFVSFKIENNPAVLFFLLAIMANAFVLTFFTLEKKGA